MLKQKNAQKATSLRTWSSSWQQEASVRSALSERRSLCPHQSPTLGLSSPASCEAKDYVNHGAGYVQLKEALRPEKQNVKLWFPECRARTVASRGGGVAGLKQVKNIE